MRLKIDYQNENPRVLKEGIDSAVKKVVKYLEKHSTFLVTGQMIDQVATISANNDKLPLVSLIGSAFKSVGNTGIVAMEGINESETHCRNIVDGIQYDKGLKGKPHFATDKDKKCLY